ncbi:hypothetical protein BT96DRAFT_945313 [Gymnopus androsaceus JB14]|uniref:Uncharacterized protein n=1 Tax=Gymnopus androsaceus JB14 TaxID=1447944 RepID=A0A6A4H0F0_9AGAR|nr:hypothetical protein BT96DRAFT_945313 [Gymnopus androsaceus JB14]
MAFNTLFSGIGISDCSCFLGGESKNGLINFISLLGGGGETGRHSTLSEHINFTYTVITVVMALTLWQALMQQYFKSGFIWSLSATQRLIVTFYHDRMDKDTEHYSSNNSGKFLIIVIWPELQILPIPLRILHSILCCCLVVHIREVANIDQKREVGELSELACSSNRESINDENIDSITIGNNGSQV